MALNITTLSQRAGKFIGGLNEALTFAGTTVVSRADTILAQYGSYSAQAEVIDDLYEEAGKVRVAVADFARYQAGRVQALLETMSRDDTTRPKSNSVEDLFEKLNRDMASQTETYSRPVVTASISAVTDIGGSNVGDGYLLASVVEPIDGLTTYYATGETIRVLCEADSYENEATEGQEPFTASGETAVDPLDSRWPKGSGAVLALAAFDPDSPGILAGAKFDDDDWTGSALDDWEAVGSSFGSLITKSTTDSYTPNVDGDAFVLLTGDGATTPLGLYQVLDQDIVKANTNYGFQFWIKASSGSGTTTLSIALRNGSAAVITDNASVSQEVAITDTIVNGSNGVWTRVSGVLRTPKNLPAELRLDIRTATAALANARTLGIDHVEFFELVAVYPGGPYVGIGSGATHFARKDGFSVVVSNSKTGTNFVRAYDRIFALASRRIRLQTTLSTASQLDSLIS